MCTPLARAGMNILGEAAIRRLTEIENDDGVDDGEDVSDLSDDDDEALHVAKPYKPPEFVEYAVAEEDLATMVAVLHPV